MASAAVADNSRLFWQDPSAPEPTNAAIRVRANQSVDAPDALFNHDVDVNDIWRGINSEAANVPERLNGRMNNGSDDFGLGLGIDEEIKVRKPRAPIAKLDEERLLSEKGIPKLRRIAKDRFKFKGKGHEFTDVSRLLNNYQLWLDDLFPKAKFADGLAIIEKLGHKKRLHVMRKEWIEEGKPKVVEDDSEDLVLGGDKTNTTAYSQDNQARTSEQESSQQIRLDTSINHIDEDIYAEPTPPPDDPSVQDTVGEREPDLDELDDLLAEDAAKDDGNHLSGLRVTEPSARNEFADEEEAMAEMEYMW